MTGSPVEINLDITPRSRFEIIDINARLRRERDDDLGAYRKALYCSWHTTAGYLEQGVCARMGHSRKQLDPFFRLLQRIFPHDAGYSHDCMPLRSELSPSEKEREPINADSHLTFISAGLKNCVTYINKPDQPVYFIDLDGVAKAVDATEHPRSRRTTVIAYNTEETVHRGKIAIPVISDRSIDSFNLKDARYGLFEQLDEWIQHFGLDKGRIDIRLPTEDRHVGLTVNEYETLLMRNDLPQVLADPLRYMVQRGRNLLRHPGSIPGKTRDYAAYDLIHLYNEFMDAVPVGRSVIDRVLSALATPASRILRLKRHITLPVSTSSETGPGAIVQGTYQSPILVQHQAADQGVRYLDVTLRSFA
ncbi:MAG: hypothetical protein GKR89_19410 [Candidatus Latescibacteria bacterium]|nr:hypothetical protein [Candidatus Latescibacterota bacterium]